MSGGWGWGGWVGWWVAEWVSSGWLSCGWLVGWLGGRVLQERAEGLQCAAAGGIASAAAAAKVQQRAGAMWVGAAALKSWAGGNVL